ncbi:MAG: prolipoprotein diacylglyceryl transferase [Victivallaceae bacterium]|nr:prolipoprotein diacylglyceryl transferase [Victivallaceae bacterium]
MHPIFLDLGFLQIHWYGVMAALAAVTAYRIMCVNRKYAGISKDQAASLIFYCVLLGGVIGARIFYVVLNWKNYVGRGWLTIFRIDQGGLVFYGGFFLAAALVVLYSRRNKLSMIAVLDVMAPALAIGHAIARIGCFLQGCCYGAVTQCALGVHFPKEAGISGGAAVHPVQLYESALNLLLGIVLFMLVRRARRGVAFSAYIIGYGTLRFLLEFLRGDAERGVWGIFSTSQLVCLALIPFGTVLLLFFATGSDAFASLGRKEKNGGKR